MLRITAGRYRGHRLQAPAGRWLRPTGDRIKQSIYNVLQDLIPGARVLDLCAGTGNLGLEAWSRGAAEVVLVERSRQALVVLESNWRRLGGSPQVRVVQDDAVHALRTFPASSFDVVLADPPYDAGLEEPLLQALEQARPGWFVLQHGRVWRLTHLPAGYRLFRSRRFGDTVVDFLVREEAADGGAQTQGGAVPGDV